jgi:hypothetical protein
MERNIDRNLRMAKREARRFFGVSGRGLARSGVYLIAMLITFGGFYLVDPYVKHLQLFQDGLGWFLVIGMFAVSALIFFLMERGFGVHLWGRPQYRFYRRKRAGEAPHRIGWRYRKNSRNPKP